MRVRLCLLMTALSALMAAEGVSAREMWGCAVMGQRQNVLYLVDDNAKSYVKFSGQRIPSRHRIEGTTHRWDWGTNHVTMTEDLIARYFEGASTDPKGMFRCKPVNR